MPALAPANRPTLFGRDDLLRELKEDFKRGRTVIGFEGPSGIGKSRLLAEVGGVLAEGFDYRIARLDAAQLASEDLALAEVFVQLRDQVGSRASLVEEFQKRAASQLPSALKKIFGAVAADLVRLATDKAEATIEAVKEAVTGEQSDEGIEAQLTLLQGDNKRYFVMEYLAALHDAGLRVGIAIDNFDRAELGVIALTRLLIKSKPSSSAVVIAHNSEVGDNKEWDLISADIGAQAGRVCRVEPLHRGAISAWFSAVVGRPPTGTELDELEKTTGGRALGLQLAIEAIRDGATEPIQRDYTGYYALARRKLDADGRAVAELLSLLNPNASVDVNLLAVAAKIIGVNSLGAALDALRDLRQIKEDDGHVSLSHSLAQRTWASSVTNERRQTLERAWYSAVESYSTGELTGPRAIGLIPAISAPLLANKSASQVAEIGEKLISAGQYRDGLELLDQTWKFGSGNASEGEDLLRHALLAARTRLDLGRYREVDEPLAQAEKSISGQLADQIEVLLLQMKLALRRNAYAALWALRPKLEQAAANEPDALLEAQQIANTAYRDLLDLEGIKRTITELLSWYDVATVSRKNAIDRSVARSLAKLGDTDAALARAESAMATSASAASIRVVGNSHLALAEVRRYRRETVLAVESYRQAAAIGRASGNRDSLLWSLLGEAAAWIEIGQPESAATAMAELDALLVEPGYEHPLETLHRDLLRTLASTSDDGNLAARYSALGISWPAELLKDFQSSGTVNRIPI